MLNPALVFKTSETSSCTPLSLSAQKGREKKGKARKTNWSILLFSFKELLLMCVSDIINRSISIYSLFLFRFLFHVAWSQISSRKYFTRSWSITLDATARGSSRTPKWLQSWNKEHGWNLICSYPAAAAAAARWALLGVPVIIHETMDQMERIFSPCFLVRSTMCLQTQNLIHITRCNHSVNYYWPGGDTSIMDFVFWVYS